MIVFEENIMSTEQVANAEQPNQAAVYEKPIIRKVGRIRDVTKGVAYKGEPEEMDIFGRNGNGS